MKPCNAKEDQKRRQRVSESRCTSDITSDAMGAFWIVTLIYAVPFLLALPFLLD